VAAAASCIPENMHPKTINIVAVVQLDCRLSLQSLSDRMNNSEYNPRRFSALTVRTKSPKTAALIFASGKMVVNGARTMGDMEQAVRAHHRAISKAGYPTCQVVSVTVCNIVATCDVCAPLRLEALQIALGGADGGAEYDTDVFAGLRYRLCDPEVTMMIFSSGKVNITGAKSYAIVLAAFEKMLPVFLLYKRD
jgi:transcription initiation factor TFIID TATA-box-binding protein